MRSFKGLVSILILISVFALVGCAATVPCWIDKGGACFSGDKKAFYGVASSSGIKDPSLKRTSADDNAINSVAKIFQVYTASLMKEYRSSIGKADTSEEIRNVEEGIKTVTSATLSGVQIVDHWEKPKTDELFALARLDLNLFKDNVENLKTLNDKAKTYIKENSDRMFNELDKEVKKAEEKGKL